MIKGAVFDMDGTLIDSMGVWAGVTENLVLPYGVNITKNDYEKMEPMSQIQVLTYLCDTYSQITKTPQELSDEMDKIVLKRYKEMSVLSNGAIECLNTLKENGVKIAVATLTARHLAQAVLEHHGIADMLDNLTIVDEVGKSKEHPDVYIMAAQKMGVLPSECIVCEDAPYGVAAAKRGGFYVCGISAPWYEEGRHILENNSDMVVKNSLCEVIDFWKNV